MPKLDLPEFHELIKQYDFICVSETKIDDIDIPNVKEKLPDGYTGHFVSRQHCSNYKSGGIGIIFKEQFAENVTPLKNNNEGVLWCLVDKKVFSFDKDLLIGSIYMPPETSRYYIKGQFEDLEVDIIGKKIQHDCYLCLGGDFNARTGELKDIINEIGDERWDFPNENNSILGMVSNRMNKDKHTNNGGYELTDLCKSTEVELRVIWMATQPSKVLVQ